MVDRSTPSGRAEPLRLLTFTTLYPNETEPHYGVFVENRLRQLVKTGEASATVVAPVPWFPSRNPVFGRYAVQARVPRHEVRNGIKVDHPRYLHLPKLGMSIAPSMLFAGTLAYLRRQSREPDFDLIDAHYFYPDGVAAVLLGLVLKKPVVITARGTDINLIPRYALPRRQIQFAARRAAGIIAVSQALKDAMVPLGVPAERIVVLRNGVDLDTFRPGDRIAARAALDVKGKTLLSVGHLIERKGNEITIDALPGLPGFTLLLAGDGPERGRLEVQAERLGVRDRVRFLGVVDHQSLRQIYVAADALVLASSREGWPNVLLEAMACGTPVVASAIWGNPEVVSRPEAGVLMKSRTPDGVVKAVEALFARLPDREATRAYAENHSWDETSAGQLRLFDQVLAKVGGR